MTRSASSASAGWAATWSRRIKRDSDHEVVAYDRDAATVERVADATGAGPRELARELVEQLDAPRIVWIMVPAGDADAGDRRRARGAAGARAT